MGKYRSREKDRERVGKKIEGGSREKDRERVWRKTGRE